MGDENPKPNPDFNPINQILSTNLPTLSSPLLSAHIHMYNTFTFFHRSSRGIFFFLPMATMTSAAVTIPSFAGLKASTRPSSPAISAHAKLPAAHSAVCAKASLKEVGVAMAAAAMSAMLSSNALAYDVLLGGSDGSLAFVPNQFTVPAGEKIVFKNNAGFPHNVVFDEDEIPSGVNASAISMSEEDLLNAPGETYSVTLSEKGTYSFYCSPHQGAGMVGKVTVN